MKDEKIIIFGAGVEGDKTLDRVGEERVSFFVDNNVELQGNFFRSKRVVSPEKLCNEYQPESYKVLISSPQYYSEIREQLDAMGIHDALSTTRFLIDEAFDGSHNVHRIILMNTHSGINVGDQLITEGELVFFEQFFPEYSIVELPADLIYEDILYIKELVNLNDCIAISGGGYMGSLWHYYGEDNVRSIIRTFPDNRIVIMPQSIFFEDSQYGRREYQISKEIYSSHRDLYICAREGKTYDLVEKMLNNRERVRLVPDMALILNRVKDAKRDRVGVCIRCDKEGILPESSRDEVTASITSEIVFFDMLADRYIGIQKRKTTVESYITMVARFKYVITDRLHCMILCVITGTPCIAFDNLTRKVSGVYEWILNNKYIHIANDIETVKELIEFYETNSEHYLYNMDLTQKKYSIIADCFY